MQLFSAIQNAISKNSEQDAFVINGNFYNYHAFAGVISRIRKSITVNIAETEKIIGLIANDDIETYAAIIALWLEGKAYVPLSPETPEDRNENIIQQAFLQTIIDSSAKPLLPQYRLIDSKNLSAASLNLIPKNVSDQELVYILFTSGTTGQPKGVSITRANLAGFITAFDSFGFNINHNDRCLQMFELTFDLSVMSYLVPILKGACIYTIPKDAIKYSYIYELMEDQKLTVALMVPSILQYLRPYFTEIKLPDMKYSLFCGEALSLDITEQWAQCVPNAQILNVYGPTEDTIFCTHFTYNKPAKNKSYNGLVSIGKAMEGTMTIIIDENDQVVPINNPGQLCLGGIQLTPGYWNNPEKNNEVFFVTNYNGKQERFYKTGDLCKLDDEGDILYIGRLDYQIKVQGFRVELSEIEFHVKSFLEKNNVVAIACADAMGNTEIGLVIESKEFDITPLNNYLKVKLPLYMHPRKIIFKDILPLNKNGKTDRNKLGLLFKNI
jgi:D-alanine--poly(phosphoribitol) ligase subunit 1